MDELLSFILMSSSLYSDGRASTIYIDEPFTVLQTDGLLSTIPIDELFPQLRWTSSYYLHLTSPSLHNRQTGSFLLFTLTSPSLPFRWTGSCLQFSLTKLFPQLRWTSSYYLHGRALPSTQTDELLQFSLTTSPSLPLQMDGLLFTIFILTSSSLNSEGRAPTIYIDEPFTAYQTDGLLPTNLIDELSPQLRWRSSYNSH